MSRPFLTSIDLNKNQILNAAFQSLAAAPSSPAVGQVYYNTVNAQPYCWNGTTWLSLSAVGTYLPLSGGTLSGGVTINDPSTTSLGSFQVAATSDTNGVNIKFTGNGTTTPSKYIRVIGGSFQILNSNYSQAILTLSDGGDLAVAGGTTLLGTLSVTGAVSGAGFTSLLGGYLPLSGGTLSGQLQGTSFRAAGAWQGFQCYDGTQGANAKYSDIVEHGGIVDFRLVDDAYSTSTSYLTVSRTGYTVDAVNIYGASINLNGPVNSTGEISGVTLSWSNNQSGVIPGTNTLGGRITENFSSGWGETDFWNLYASATQSFAWYQRTGTPTASLLATLSPVGNLAVSGVLNVNGGWAGISGVAGSWRALAFSSVGSTRWNVFADSAAEAGSNAGSNFQISSYNDAGNWLASPLTINRASGVVTLASLSTNNGTFTGYDSGAFNWRVIGGSYGAGIRNDGTTVYLMSTASGSPNGSYNGLRPFYWNLSTGTVGIAGDGAATSVGGSLAVAGTSLTVLGASNVTLTFRQTGGAADAKAYDYIYDSGTAYFRFVNDAGTAATNWLTAERSGYAASLVTINSPTQISGTMGVSGFFSLVNGGTIGGAGAWFGSNAGYAAGWKYVKTDFAWYLRSGGWTGDVVSLNVAPSGTAGATMTPINVFTVDQTGVVTFSQPIVGAGVTANFAAPPPIGSTTPNSGAFTTLSATGNLTAGGTVTASGGTVTAIYASSGYIDLQAGNPTNTGYIALYNAAGVRQGYIGYAAASGLIQLASEGTATGYNVSGNLNVVGSINAASGNVFNAIGRNRVDNGDMSLAQRTLPITANSSHNLDRWIHTFSAGTASISQSSTAGYTSRNQLRGVFTGLTAGAVATFTHRIEAARSYDLAGQQVTISLNTAYTVSAGSTSFAVRLYYCNVADTFSAVTAIGSAIGFTPSATPGTYSATFTLPSAATTGLQIGIAATQATATGTLTWAITSVQLEQGTVATPFERIDPQLNRIRCWRFYQAINALCHGYTQAANTFYSWAPFTGGPMRSGPTITYVSSSGSLNANTLAASANDNRGATLSAVNSTIGPTYCWAWISFTASADLT